MNTTLIRPMSDAEIDAVNGGIIAAILVAFIAGYGAASIGIALGNMLSPREPEVLVPNLFP